MIINYVHCYLVPEDNTRESILNINRMIIETACVLFLRNFLLNVPKEMPIHISGSQIREHKCIFLCEHQGYPKFHHISCHLNSHCNYLCDMTLFLKDIKISLSLIAAFYKYMYSVQTYFFLFDIFLLRVNLKEIYVISI